MTAPLTDEQRRAIHAADVPLIGRPYSSAGLLSLGLASFTRLVAHIWKAVGFDPVGRPAQSVTPGRSR